jgi:sugar phosphate isomerase/epimerase
MKFGIDLFSIRSSGFNAFEYLDYCAKWKAKVVHFSEIRFLGNLEPEHLKKVRAHAAKLGIELEIGMRSICPSSKAFDPNQGTAEEQLGRMIDAAKAIGAKLVRAFLGTSADRTGDIPIEGHIENTAKVLRNVRSRVVDAGLKVAVENHAGDMQARELKMLIEAAGKDFTGACIDSGNPLWTIEDPHLTLEVLAPYVLTSHVRDSHVYRTPEGAAVHWVRLGEGNVDIVGWMRKFGEVCAGKAMSLETLVTGPRMYPYLQPGFWGPYRKTPAWEFARFVSLVEKGTPIPKAAPAPKEQAAQREREDLEACIRYWQQVFGA